MSVANGGFSNADDAFSAAVPIGFNFTFGGTTYSQVYMSTNGVMYFTGPSTAYSNTGLSTQSTRLGVYPLWDDLYVGTGGVEALSRGLYYTTGAPGSRVFILQWTNWYSYSETSEVGTFNVVLHEGTNKIDIYYRNMLGASALRQYGLGATIGLSVSSSYYTQYSLNSPVATEGKLLSYTPSAGGTSPYALTVQEVTPATTAGIESYFLTYLLSPKVPVNLSAAPNTPASTSATLSWDLSVQGVTPASYTLRYSTNANMTGFTQVTGIMAQSYVLGGLNPGTTYYWQVVATDGIQNSVSTTSEFTQVLNHVPVAQAGSLTMASSTSGHGFMEATDSDNTPTTSGLIYSVTTPPGVGTVTITNSATGAFTYTPPVGFTGTISFGFKAFDGTAYSAEATFSIDVQPGIEIAVAGNGQDIASGDVSPSVGDGTAFGSVAVSSGSVVRTFTISNSGGATLHLSGVPAVSLTGSSAFSVSSQPPATVAGGSFVTFAVTFDPASGGGHAATVSITSDDADENPFTFAVSGTGLLPEVAVHDGNNTGAAQLTAGQAAVVDFGTTQLGVAISRAFTIANTGGDLLAISAITAPAGFTVLGAPTSVAAGSSATFIVRFDAASVGVFTGALRINSDDQDESSFAFPIKATGVYPPLPLTNQLLSTGAPAPDMPGQVISGFFDYSINGSGKIMIHVLTRGPAGALLDNAVYSDANGPLEMIVREGDAVPGAAAGQVWTGTNVDFRLSETGKGFFLSQARGPGVTLLNDYFGQVDDGVAVKLFAREGASFRTINRCEAMAADADLAFFEGGLITGQGGVVAANDTGIWSVDAGTAFATEVVREGTPISGAGKLGQLATRVSSSLDGTIAYQGSLVGVPLLTNTAVFKLPAGATVPTVLARKADPAPGVPGGVFNSFLGESVSATGDVLIEACLKPNAALGIAASCDEGLWVERSGALQKVIREGDPVGGVLLSRVDRHWLLADGTVVVRGVLKGAGVGTANDVVVFSVSPAGVVEVLLREGSPVAELGGSKVALLSRFDISPAGKWVSVFSLVNGTGDAVAANNVAVLKGTMGTAGYEIVLRRGEMYQVGASAKKLNGFLMTDSVGNLAGGTGGQGSAVNDSGTVALGIYFSDYTQGFFVGQ
ncbi:MAG: choice-of-anchor D domain-containing protein [Verrucomicrobiales bacterium]|nr:choice-of-anchor D domain-containing protein [Verrucomicrobiales bacterium]MCP5560235.1 choice-of-anchor D domain-containing protein [Verrucomicrobiaceae bacterium]